MMKFLLTAVIFTMLLSACDMKEFNPAFETSVNADNYPSGSTVSFLGDKFYVMGDDASEILILGHDLKELDRIVIFPAGEKPRLPKASKADIEASVVVRQGSKNLLLFLGSGSFSPHRDSTFLLNPVTKEVIRSDARLFYTELRKSVSDLNIEAAAMVDTEIVIGLRGNTTFPDNYIVTAYYNGSELSFKRKILLKTPLKQAGISGMDYDAEEDILFITFSSEATQNSYDDGQIGESYLVIVTDAIDALSKDLITIGSPIKLSELSPDFLYQKIESVSLMKDKRKLLLVADDDKGNTKLFTLKY